MEKVVKRGDDMIEVYLEFQFFVDNRDVAKEIISELEKKLKERKALLLGEDCSFGGV